MKMPTFVRLLILSAGLIVAAGARVPAESDAELFDPSVLQEIRLSISTRDLAQLRERFEDNTYYAADFQWRDTKIRNVGIRSRGRASRSSSKLGIQVDFNRYVTGQRFVGLKALVLDNLWQDPSMVRERVSMAFFTRMGLPAPRISYAKVYINNEYQGVYGAVEAIDSVFAARAFGETGGYLFEYKKQPSYTGAYLGEELDAYKQLFEARTHEKEPDGVLYPPLRDLFREMNQPRHSLWRETVSGLANLEQIVRYVAVETYLAEDDGFLGSSGMSNFYVYRSEGSNAHRLIAWDKDLAFAGTETSVLTRVEDNELFRRLMAFRAFRMLYFDSLEEMAKSAREEAWLRKEIAQSAGLIRKAVYEDPGKPFSNEEFEEAVRWVRQFPRLRSMFVLKNIKELRQARWTPSYWDVSER
jgi:spore coat protein CotH